MKKKESKELVVKSRENFLPEVVPGKMPRSLEEIVAASERIKAFPISIIDEAIKASLGWMEEGKILIDYPSLISSDWHIPHTSTEWVKKLLAVQELRKVSTLVINGDYLDQKQFSKWLEVGPRPISWEQELEVGREILTGLLKFFDKIIIILGNHDERMLKDLGKKFERVFSRNYAELLFGEMLEKAVIGTRVCVTNLKFCETRKKNPYNPEKGEWMICHPDAYSKTGAKVPVDITNVEFTNVIGAHGHHLAAAKHPSGKFWGIDGGGMFNEHSITYKERSKNSLPKWNNGFVLLNEKGEARLYGEGLEMI